jgi:OHCU decarboxylase
MSLGLQSLNSLPRDAAEAELLRCCGSQRWARAMAAKRPFPDAAALIAAADETWSGLDPADWLQAFAQHPRIGERALDAPRCTSTGAWAATEQAGAANADDDLKRALEEGNRVYERRFNHVFIICASGKSATQMLASLQARLNNDPETERRIAAQEQAMITRLRLQKLVNP